MKNNLTDTKRHSLIIIGKKKNSNILKKMFTFRLCQVYRKIFGEIFHGSTSVYVEKSFKYSGKMVNKRNFDSEFTINSKSLKTFLLLSFCLSLSAFFSKIYYDPDLDWAVHKVRQWGRNIKKYGKSDDMGEGSVKNCKKKVLTYFMDGP